MKRYMLFISDRYYPMGGAKDYIRSANTIQELKDLLAALEHNYTIIEGNIFDTETEEIVTMFYADIWSPK